MRTEPTAPAEVLAAVRAALAPGAQTVDCPILQPLGLLLDLAGEAMRARLFIVQAEGGAEVCLRPDFTAPVVRAHLDSGAESGRYFYEGRAFRAAQGPDWPEDFLQMGLESFAPAGAASVEADAEIAGLAWQAAIAGGRGDLTLWLGDVALFAAFIESLSLPGPLAARLKRVAGRPRLLQAELARAGQPSESAEPSRLAALLSGLDEADAAALLEEVWALAGVEPVGGRRPAEIAARLVRRSQAAASSALSQAQAAAIHEFMSVSAAPASGLAQIRQLGGKTRGLQDALGAWERRIALLAKTVPSGAMRFAPALGHAFDYYDGLTFEVRSEHLGAERPVAVGGRYDGLLTRLGGPDGGGAVGCMVRPWRAFAGGEA